MSTRFTAADLARTSVGRAALKKLNLDRIDRASPATKEHTDRLMRAAAGEIEAIFEVQLLAADLTPPPEFQYPPMTTRKIRLDVAFRLRKIGFEVQGHVHRIRAQFLSDMERHNLLQKAGWRLFYVSGDMVRSGRGIALVREVLALP